MGRKTYFGIPPSKRPLPGRLNIVLSRTAASTDYPDDVLVCGSLPEAMERLNGDKYAHQIENIWIVGGHTVYKEAMESDQCHRIYFTEIKATYECDTFFPAITERFRLVGNDHSDIPSDVQQENGIEYQYKIYEKV